MRAISHVGSLSIGSIVWALAHSPLASALATGLTYLLPVLLYGARDLTREWFALRIAKLRAERLRIEGANGSGSTENGSIHVSSDSGALARDKS